MFTGKAQQLTIYIGESDTWHHQSAYAAILEMLRREGCGGATVTRGVAGFGASSVIHTTAILRLSADLPIVITVIDRPARIERVLGVLKEMAPQVLATLIDVEIVQSGMPFKEGLPDVNVGEVMRPDPISIGPDDLVIRVVELLLDRDFTALPVVDGDRKVIGVISDSDLLSKGGVNVALSLKRAADADFVRELHRNLKSPERKVREVMTSPAVTTTAGASLGAAAKVMVARHLKRLPVVDGEGRLIGVLGRLDVLNTIAAVRLAEWHPGAIAPQGRATVGDVLNKDVATVEQSATIEQLFGLLVGSSHKRVVVVDTARHVVGIVADSDLISRVSRETWPGLFEILVSHVPIEKVSAVARKHIAQVRARTAAELMTPSVVTVHQEMPVESALALSAEKRIKRLPVVNSDGMLVGIVGRSEMLAALLAAEAGGEDARL
jgi:CBS-domain-containing membrane protein/PII-like signaling protein